MKLSEAVGIYLRLKGQGRPVTFHRAAERSCGYVIDVCGDRDITAYTKADANAFRDDLIKRGLAGSSITRVFGTVRSVINFAASEIGIDLTNPFGKVYYDRTAGVEDRAPLPLDAIRTLQAECRALDDDLRWLVALVSDTGMRLAEAAGLMKEDLKLDDPIPHVVVREHPWRRLKTAGSSRMVPLAGAALWAAQRVHENVTESKFAFPPIGNSAAHRVMLRSGGELREPRRRWRSRSLKNDIRNHGRRRSSLLARLGTPEGTASRWRILPRSSHAGGRDHSNSVGPRDGEQEGRAA